MKPLTVLLAFALTTPALGAAAQVRGVRPEIPQGGGLPQNPGGLSPNPGGLTGGGLAGQGSGPNLTTTLPAGGTPAMAGADSTSSDALAPINDEAVDAELDRYVSETGLDALPVSAKTQAIRRDRN